MPSIRRNKFLAFNLTSVLVLALFFRLPSFFLEIIDPDEWTYWISAREWLSGKALYTEIIDIKPPGIFMLFAALIKATFGVFFIARIWVALLLGIAAWSLGKLTSGLLHNAHYQWPAAILFLSGFSYPFAQALNTEVFFVGFSCLGMYLLLAPDLHLAWKFPGFLLLGFAFIVKYTVLSDISLVFLWLLIPLLLKRQYLSFFLTGALCLILVHAPFALTHLYFYLRGSWDAFVHVVYVMPGKYAGTGNVSARIDLLALFHYRFFWLVILAYHGLYLVYSKQRVTFFLIVYWMLASWAMILLPGKLHDHYWLQLIPAYAIAAAVSFSHFIADALSKRIAVIGFIILFGFSTLRLYQKTLPYNLQIKKDKREFLTYFGSQQTVWYAGMPAIYYASNCSSVPTPYIHGSLLFSEQHIQGFGIAIPQEWQKALDQSDVVVIPVERSQEQLYQQVITLCKKKFNSEISSENDRYLIFSRGDVASE